MKNSFQPNRLSNYDDNSIISEIKRVVSKYFRNKAPRKKDFEKFSMVKGWVIHNRFGSYANAMERAGFKYDGLNYASIDVSREKFTKEKMIEDLNRLKNLNQGKYFTQDFYIKNGGKYSVKTLKKHFGKSWQIMLENIISLRKEPIIKILKIPPQGKRTSQYTEEQLFSEMKKIWDKLGRRPSYDEFKKNSPTSIWVYEQRFGTWKKAIESFCSKFGYNLQGRAGTSATPEILLSELKTISSKISSDILTFKKYKENGGTYSIGTFQAHFGNWKNAVEKIGKNDGHSGKYSEVELFAELQHLWEMLGKQPTYKDMNLYGKISGKAFQNKFGSWMKAIHAFCTDREKDEEFSSEEEIITETNTASEKTPETTTLPETPQESYILKKTSRTPSLRLRWKVMKRDNFRCRKCGRSPATELGIELEIDHDVAYSKPGGETVFENLQTLCKDCNRGKSNLSDSVE